MMVGRNSPKQRRLIFCAAGLMLGALLAAAPAAAKPAHGRVPPRAEHSDGAVQPFHTFIESLWPEAKARGISRAIFDEAFRGVALDPKVVALTKKQSEFVRPIWDYLGDAVSPARLARGRALAAAWSGTLDRIEKSFGVPRSVLLGIWGMETNFGADMGSMDIVRSLATLAYVRYRGDFFRGELVTALEMLERDHITRAAMRGSWAGAMGHTQFMPSSFVQYAADGDGDGRRDIWNSVPDALASTANYLRQKGWQPGLPWGFEVRLPERFDFRNHRLDLARWAELGLKRVDGGALPRSGEAMLFLPGGATGPAFLVTANYDVIKAYNSSDAYALGVAHLGERVLGAGPIAGRWPRDEPVLDHGERQEVQHRLASLGYYVGEADGKLGAKTRDAVRRFQLDRGLVADGYPNRALLQRLQSGG